MKKLVLISLLGASLLNTGCVPIVIGGLATAGYLSSQERGATAAIMDSKIKTHIKDRLTSKNYRYLTQVEVTVLQGSVLLTGVVDSAGDKTEVEAIVKSTDDVSKVHNNLFYNINYGKTLYAKDSWMAAQVRTKLLTASDVYSINYFINVVNGHAYILGLAETQSEMERAVYIARTVGGIKKVHNYIRFAKRGLQKTPNQFEQVD